MAETSFFPPDIPPVHKGVYRVQDASLPKKKWYAYWNGKCFGYRAASPINAYDCRRCFTCLPGRTVWWGLTTKGGK